MTTFLFMLTLETERVLVERVMYELAEQFPEHEFVAGGADIPDFENSILAIHGPPESSENPGVVKPPVKAELQRVKEAFAAILEGAQDWKPS